MDDWVIEQATWADMPFLLSLAKAEGWNPGLHDAEPFYESDPKGYFIGKVGAERVGCLSAVAYDRSYGFLGLYILKPDWRGHGYGIKLWNYGMQYLGDRVIGLDGVVSQQENYKKSGFTFSYNNIRFGGKAIVNTSNIQDLYPLIEVPFDALLQFDSSIFGLDRARFLHPWIRMPNSYGFAKMVNNQLVGYGLIRKCGKGYKIGPLFANDPLIAEELFLALCSKSGGEEIFFDVPELNSPAIDLAQKHSLTKVFETARMYKGSPPAQQISKVFGITTFELG